MLDHRACFLVAACFASSAARLAQAADPARPSDPPTAAAREVDGFRIHELRSENQPVPTQVRVLLPDNYNAGREYSVIYLLPVEAKSENRYGDGLVEVKRQNLANQRNVIFVAPTFAQLPWYADHPSDPTIRQESHFVNVVVPFVEKNYAVGKSPERRLLLGFSKSGWGAFSLLLRHPETFGKAAAWDAPLMMEQVGKYGNRDIFGTQANFEEYRIPALITQRAGLLQRANRLVLLGFGNFRAEHQALHALLEDRRILHVYRDGPQRKHDWHSGWVTEAVELLLEK